MTWVTWRRRSGGAGRGEAGRGPGRGWGAGRGEAGRGPGRGWPTARRTQGKLEAEPPSQEHLTGPGWSIPVGRAENTVPPETDGTEGTRPARKASATM